MDGDDRQLKTLLKRWPEIEPRPAFDQDVLRRIRLERTKDAGVSGLWAARLTSRWGIVAVVLAAAAVGAVLAGVTPVYGKGDGPAADSVPDLLAEDSVSGSYVAMLNGGGR